MKKRSARSIVSLLLVVVMLFASCGVDIPTPDETDSQQLIKSVTPTEFDERGVALESGFILELNRKVSEEELYSTLDIQPSMGEYSLTGSDKSWTLLPTAELKGDQVYAIRSLTPGSLRLQDSFAFQTQTDLRVSNTFPASQSGSVSPNTGIEITFNVEGVAMEDYFTIEPEVKGTFQTVGYQSTFIPEEPLADNTLYLVTIHAGLQSPSEHELAKDFRFSFVTQTTEEQLSDPLFFNEGFVSTHLAGQSIWLEVGFDRYNTWDDEPPAEPAEQDQETTPVTDSPDLAEESEPEQAIEPEDSPPLGAGGLLPEQEQPDLGTEENPIAEEPQDPESDQQQEQQQQREPPKTGGTKENSATSSAASTTLRRGLPLHSKKVSLPPLAASKEMDQEPKTPVASGDEVVDAPMTGEESASDPVPEKTPITGEDTPPSVPADGNSSSSQEEPVAGQIENTERLEPENLTMELYQFPDIETYEKTVRDYYTEGIQPGVQKDFVVNSEDLEPIVELPATLLEGSNRFSNYLILPEDLAVGEYLVNLTYTLGKEKRIHQHVFSVTNYNVYLQHGNQDFLAWINDITTGDAVSKMDLSVEEAPSPYSSIPQEEYQSVSAQTGADGIATIDCKISGRYYLSLRQDNELLYFEPFSGSSWGSSTTGLNKQYYNYLFTDRERYRPTDTINFWGTILPRTDELSTPDYVWVRLQQGEKNMLPKQKLAVDENGAFSASLDYTLLDSLSYYLSIVDDEDNAYVSKSIYIREYEKPSYLITSNTDKEYYHFGDDITVTLSATYYDGNPVQNREFDLYLSYTDYATTQPPLRLGESGTASVTTKLRLAREDAETTFGWRPDTVGYSFNPLGDSPEGLYTAGSFTLLPSEVVSQVESDLGKGTVTVDTAVFDMDALNDDTTKSFTTDFERYGKEPTDIPITLEIKRADVIKTPRETHYDAVNKKNITYYDYSMETTTVDTIETKTANGTVTLELEPYTNTEDSYFWVEVYYQGVGGAVIKDTSQTIYPWYGAPEDGVYTFLPTTNLYGTSESLAIGEDITLGLYQNGEKVTDHGKVLYTISQDELQEVGFYTDSEVWTMNRDNLPNVLLSGAVFDGVNIIPIQQSMLSFDYSMQELSLSIASDLKEYKPGDTATLTLELTDLEGNPVEGSVCIAAVDEADFADAPQTVDVLGELYQNIYYPDIRQNVLARSSLSAPQSIAESAASEDAGPTGGGGGGPDQATVRKTFVDTAYFEALETDSSGMATVTMKLPDNITSWRITALAVTKEVMGGNTATSAITTLPFYISTVITPTYLEGDDVVIALDGRGGDTPLGEELSFDVEVKDSKGNTIDTQTKTGSAGNRNYLSLGKLETGSYKVTVQASSDDYKDAMEQDIIVAEQGLTVRRSTAASADQWDWDIQPQRYPIEIIAHDAKLKPLLDTANWLSYQYGERTEVVVANYFARRALYEMSTSPDKVEPYKTDQYSSLIEYQSSGFPALLAGEADVETTAKVIAVAQEELLNSNLISYFNSELRSLDSNLHQRVMALLGLAVSKQPVLLTIKEQLQNNTDLSVKDKLYLAAGLAALGDQGGALEVYAQVGENLTSPEEQDILYLDIGTETENNEATAAALLALSFLDHPEAAKLAEYLLTAPEDKNQQAPYNLELMAFVQNYTLPEENKNATVTYLDANGEEKTVSLAENNNWVSVLLTQEEFENKQLESAGNVEYRVFYRDYVPLSDNKDIFDIKKEYVSEGAHPTLGEVIRVDITVTPKEDTASGFYTFSDQIPSGMRYTPLHYHDWSRSNQFFWLREEGQRITSTFFYDSENLEEPTLESFYYVNSVLPGDFTVESAVILDYLGEVAAVSAGETEITID